MARGSRPLFARKSMKMNGISCVRLLNQSASDRMDMYFVGCSPYESQR